MAALILSLATPALWSAVPTEIKADSELHRAADRGDVEQVRALLQSGVSADVRNAFGHTPLMIAAKHAAMAVAELLLAAKADPNATERDRLSVLHIAMTSDNPAIVELLLRHGAKPDHKGSREMKIGRAHV